jgi:hypothetical protein
LTGVVQPGAGGAEAAQRHSARVARDDYLARTGIHRGDRGASEVNPRRALVQRADDETPRLDDELADAAERRSGTVRSGTQRRIGGLPGKLNEFRRILRHVDETVAEALLEPQFAQQPDQGPEAIGELFEDELHRVGAVAENKQHGGLLDGDGGDVPEAGANGARRSDLKRQAGRVDGDDRRLGVGLGSDQPALTLDLDRF